MTYTNSHTSELSVELGNDLSDGLGGSCACRDEIVQGTSSCTPVLSSLGRSVNNQLVGSSGVDSGHKTLNDTELVVQDLGEGSKAVGSAGCVGEDSGTGVGGVVDSHHVHGSIGRRCRNNHALAASLDVGRGLLNGGKDAGGLANDISTNRTPPDLFGVAASKELNLYATNNKAVTFHRDFSRVHAVDRVVFELVSGVVDAEEGIVDSDDRGIGVI